MSVSARAGLASLPVLPPLPGVPGCASSDPAVWFSDDPEDWRACRRVCLSCPVLDGCLAGALRRSEPCGVWGGVVFPAKVRYCLPIQGAHDDQDGGVWRLRLWSDRGEVVVFGTFSSRQAAAAAAEQLLRGRSGHEDDEDEQDGGSWAA